MEYIYAEIQWADGNNIANTRPKTVTLKLLDHGEVITTQTVKEDEYGEWEMEFDVTSWCEEHPDAEFSVTADDVAGYTKEIKSEEGAYLITFRAEALTVTINGVTGSFNDKIKLNYYFSIPEVLLEDSDAYVTLTNESTGKTTTILVKDAETGKGDGLKFSILLAAKEAGDKITARVFDAVTADTLSGYVADRAGTLPAGVSIKGITAMLESDNTLRLYLGFKDVDPNDFTYAIDGKDADLNMRSDGAYYLALKAGVYSNHLQDTHTYSVSDGTNTYTITASVLTYARACANKSDEAESNLGKTLYLYNQAAVAAFNQ